jgi:hypothetical protein
MNPILKAAGIAAVALSFAGTASVALAKDCDRECLIDTANAYLAALAAHNPEKVDLADNVSFVENLEPMQPGEGLWETGGNTAASFKILVPDPVSQGVGGIVMMEENGKPIELGFRLMLKDGKIAEVQHLIARNLSESSLKRLERPRAAFLNEVALPYRDSRSRLLYIGAAYYDALDENNGSLAPFADDCVRLENGMQTDRNTVPDEPGDFAYLGALGCEAQLDTLAMVYIDTIANRSVLLADPLTGLTLGLSHFHHSMTEKDYRIIGVPGQPVRHMEVQPFDMPAMHIYKIWGGEIHEIEAVGIVSPYNSPNGWESD